MNHIGFTRSRSGFRAWFPVSKNGALETGLPPSAFTVTVLDIDDSATASYSVSESAQKAGMYFFDVPSSFLEANGVGEYGMVVEVLASGLKAVAGGVLQVSEEDMRAMHLVRYGGEVHIDVGAGVAGTGFGVGTEDNPSSNFTDAKAIATRNGIRRFHVRGLITLTDSLDDWVVIGDGEESEINLNGQDVANSEFRTIKMTGAIGNGPVRAYECELDDVSGFSGSAYYSTLLAGTLAVVGNTSLHRCASGVPGTGTPTVDMGGLAVGVEMRAYAGGVRLTNLANVGAVFSIDFVSGQVIVDASCTAMASGRIGGTARYQNDSALVFNTDGLVNPAHIWRGIVIPPSGQVT